MWGTFGQVLSRDLLAAKVEQYPDNVGIYEEFIRSNYLGKRTADCVGFIKLKLFFKWGIQFGEPLQMPDLGKRPVQYASREELEAAILKAYPLLKNKPGEPWETPVPALITEQEASGLVTKKEES